MLLWSTFRQPFKETVSTQGSARDWVNHWVRSFVAFAKGMAITSYRDIFLITTDQRFNRAR